MLVFLSDTNATTGGHLGAPASLNSRIAHHHSEREQIGDAAHVRLPGGAASTVQSPSIQQGKPTGNTGALQAVAPFTANRQMAAPTSSLLPNVGTLGERVPFDWKQVQLKNDNKEWKLTLGGYVLATFGTDEQSAKKALAAMTHYRFTEQCLFGQPKPVFSYYLVNGQAPHGVIFGVNAIPFLPESLEVKQIGKVWVVCAGNQMVIPFGDNEEAARLAKQAIQQHRFDTYCQVGAGNGTGMTFLTRVR